jgi:hypothetical protein
MFATKAGAEAKEWLLQPVSIGGTTSEMNLIMAVGAPSTDWLIYTNHGVLSNFLRRRY